jgi:aspartate carbamoyltransferase catalytic subunit
MRSFMGRDIIDLIDMERNEYMHILETALELEPIARSRTNAKLLEDKTMVTAFYQPSTRTRLAHEAAMHRLGGRVVGFSDAKMTRAGDFYQESNWDTFHMLQFYGDVIVMRHFDQKAPYEAAEASSIPIINGGNGWGSHPTQVLTDLYTIQKEKGTLDGLNILMVGDMRMRTMHSLSRAMTNFDMYGYYCAPPDMSLTEEFHKELTNRGNKFEVVESVEDCISDVDVIYMEPVVQPDYTVSRQEKQDEYGLTPKQYQITKKLLVEKAKNDAIVLHSLPRMDELTPDVDKTRYARYWEEAFNGVVMRMALISLVLGAME